MSKPRVAFLNKALLLIALAGCQPAATPVNNGGKPLPEYHPGSLDDALGSDDCSVRMHDIEGALLSYCANNHNRLPDTLDQLRDVPGLGGNVNLICPVTNTPFVYEPAGRYLASDPRRLILWEPTASHNGSRSCLLIPKLEPGSSVVPEVKLIPEPEFQKAIPAIQ